MRAAVCLAGIALFLCVGCQKADPPPVRVIDAQELRKLIQGGSGKVVVLNFWATWCAPCVQEMPDLIKFYRDEAKSLVFLSVSVDDPDVVQERVQPFLKEKGVPFPVYVLKERSPAVVEKALNLEWTGGVPATFVFDKGGQLIKAWDSEIMQADLTGVVNRLL